MQTKSIGPAKKITNRTAETLQRGLVAAKAVLQPLVSGEEGTTLPIWVSHLVEDLEAVMAESPEITFQVIKKTSENSLVGPKVLACLPINKIKRERNNSRTVYDEINAVQPLAKNIKESGLNTPIEVYYTREEGFVLSDGETRLKSVSMNGERYIDAYIVHEPIDTDWITRVARSRQMNAFRSDECVYDTGRLILSARKQGYDDEVIKKELHVTDNELKRLAPACDVGPLTHKALVRLGRHFNRHGLESIKRLSAFDDQAAAKVVEQITVNLEPKEVVSKVAVATAVDLAFKAAEGATKPKAKVAVSSRHIEIFSGKKKQGSIKVVHESNGGLRVALTLPPGLSEEGLSSLEKMMEMFSSKGFKNQEKS